MSRIAFYGIVFTAIVGFPLGAWADDSPGVQELRQAAVETLQAMKATYATQYAPKAWKKEYAGWDLDSAYEKAEVEAESANTLQEARASVVRFASSMKDYHHSVSFFSTEGATLPFTVKTVQGRTFFVNIDRDKLPKSAFPFAPGDEVLSFNGRSIAEELGSLIQLVAGNVPGTDLALADQQLTERYGFRGVPVPQGKVVIGVRQLGDTQVKKYSLVWDYSPDQVGVPFSVPKSEPDLKNQLQDIKMVGGLRLDSNMRAHAFSVGNRSSFIPVLGEEIWTNPEEIEETIELGPFSMKKKRRTEFDAYIYKNKAGRSIGVIRIPNYSPRDAQLAVKDFGEIINKFESETDGLVIDQINNPGGGAFYLYALASMLSPEPLKTLRHKFAITPAKIARAIGEVNRLSQIETDSEIQAILGPTLQGFPVTYSLAQSLKNYFRSLIESWRQGRAISEPLFLKGLEMINPSTQAVYSKPLLVVVNELCFSGGDFFPAILQDNKRATILGHRTAGAGGLVEESEIASILGVDSFSVTTSIGERNDGNPIENLGVSPDIVYDLTVDDVQSGFRGYAAAIQKGIDSLLTKK